MIKRFYLWITGRTYKPDFHDDMMQLDPPATPILSSVKHDKALQVFTEWQVDAFVKPMADNAQVLGSTDAEAFIQTYRRGNYLQFSYHMAEVTGSPELLAKTAEGEELIVHRCNMSSKMLMRDIECSLLSDNVASPGGADKPVVAAGLGSAIKTNVIDCTGGTPPVFSFGENGYPQVAAVAGQKPSQYLTQSMVDELIAKVFMAGGLLDNNCALVMHPSIKKYFDGFPGVATEFRSIAQPTGWWRRVLNWLWTPEPPFKWVGVHDIYVSHYGNLNVIADRFMPADRVYLLDPALLRISFLRRFKKDPVPAISDSKRWVILGEWTLKVLNEAGLGQIRGLTCTP